MAAPTPDKAAMMDKASAALNHAVDVSTGKTHDALVLYRDIRHDPGAAQDASVNAVFAAVVSCQNAGAKVSLSGG